MRIVRRPVLSALGLGACALLLGACLERTDEPESATCMSYGAVMADIGRRFELLGRAATASRFALAEYELDEIVEQFQGALSHAAPPREGHPEVLGALASTFLQANVPDLRRDLAARVRVSATAAFERTAKACNGCHEASGHGFIEVPLVAGRRIPSTDPEPLGARF